MASDFENQVKAMAEKAVLKIIGEGNWVMPSYEQRFKMPADFIAQVYALIDVEKVKRQLATRIEAELADRLVNHIAAEMATDIKQILSVKERREALRAVVRDHFDTIMKAGSLEGGA